MAETLRKLDPPRGAKLNREISTSFADPDTQEGNLTLGLKYFAEGPDSYSFALRAFRRVIVLKGATDYVSWASLAARQIGGIYRLQEKYRKAVEAYQQAIRFNPRDPDNQLALGRVYRAQGQKGKALEVQRILQTLDKAKAQELLGEINKAGPAVPLPTVRFDGLYRTTDSEYLRFYEDGTVIGARFRGSPNDVARVLKKPYGTTGHLRSRGPPSSSHSSARIAS